MSTEKIHVTYNDMPGEYQHMGQWGVIYGFYFAWGFAVLFWNAAGAGFDILAAFTMLLAFTPFWFLFGAIPGLIIGLVMGAVISAIIRPEYIDSLLVGEHLRSARQRVLPFVGISATLLMFIVMFFIVGFLGADIAANELDFATLAFYVVPPLLAGGLSAFAANRYLNRVSNWSQAMFGDHEKPKRKAKSKPDRLKATDDQSDTENTSEFATLATIQNTSHMPMKNAAVDD